MTGKFSADTVDGTPTLFDDGKDTGALRTIGEVASALRVKTHVLRYWEKHFPMLRPMQRSGGRRYYRPQDVALLVRIDNLVNQQGYTIKGARLAIGTGTTSVAPPPKATPDGSSTKIEAAVVPRLKAIRARLASALETA